MRKIVQLICKTFVISIFSIHHSFSQSVFEAKVDYAVGSTSRKVALGDVNGDGKDDLVVINLSSNNVSVLINNGVGVFSSKTDYICGYRPQGLALGDINNDNKLDILIVNTGDLSDPNKDIKSISILTNTGSGSFAPKKEYILDKMTINISVGDINQDRNQDIILTNGGNSSITVLTNAGNGSFDSKVDYQTGGDPSHTTIADINLDGFPDLIVTNAASPNLEGNSISILTNTGFGTFGTKINYTTGENPYGSAIGDLNGDGKIDIAIANRGDNNVAILFNNGDGTFGNNVVYPTGTSPTSIAIADLNGDSKPDLFVSNQGDGTVSVLTNTGSGMFSANTTYQVDGEPWNLSVRDLNGDNTPDVVVANLTSNASVLLSKLGSQKLDLPTSKKITYGSTFLSTATSGLSVSLYSSNSSILKTSFNSATATGIGIVTITGIQSGNELWFGITTTGVLTITKANLTVSSYNTSKIYGESNPSLSGTVLGMVNNDVIPVNYSTSATQFSAVGQFPITQQITPNAVNIANYLVTSVNGLLTISPKSATIIGFNASRAVGASNPTFDGSLVGVLNDDDVQFSASTIANANSVAGDYAIVVTATGNSVSNYTFTLVNGTLTVTTPTAITEIKPSKFSIYPNPSTGSFFIEIKDIAQLEKVKYLPVQIYNAEGSIVFEKLLINGINEIETSLSQGFYLVKIGEYKSKLVVE